MSRRTDELEEQIDQLNQAGCDLQDALETANNAGARETITDLIERANNALQDQIERLLEEQHAEEAEEVFHETLKAHPDDGYMLVDDGTLDTVLQCPKCGGWLRFDGREAATMFLENDDACWLCSHE